jgi:2-dehydropantoate 2-reductase
MKNRIVILGAGGIGTVIGAALAEKYYRQTTLIGRKDHVKSINKDGCTITGCVNKNVKAHAEESAVNGLENTLLIVSVKITGLENSLLNIKHLIRESTTLLLVQNGYGVKDIARKTLSGILPTENVYQAVVTFGAVLTAPGNIELFPGGLKAEKAFGDSEYGRIFESTFLQCRITKSLDKAIWKKLIINSIVNPLSVIFRVKNKIIADYLQNGLKEALLNEGREVAKSEGYSISLSVADVNAFIRSDNRTSMLQDYFKKRPNEIDFINGAIIRIGEKNGDNVCTNKIIYSIVKDIEKIRLEGKEEAGI